MMQETNTFQQILNAFLMIAWPLLYVVIAIAGVLLFRAEKRHFNLCIAIGAALAFLTSIAHLMYFVPGMGLVNKGGIDPDGIQKFYQFTGAVNVIAMGLIAYGILMHAIVFFKTRQNANLAEDLHR